MSHYEQARTAPRHATQENVADQVRRLQQQLEQQLQEAQSDAATASIERINNLQREQTRRVNDSIQRTNERINSLNETTRRNLEEMDRHHREQLSQLTNRVYDDINTAQRNLANKINRQLDHLASDVSDKLQGLDTRLQRQQRDINSINEQMDVLTQGIGEIVSDIDQHFERNEREISSLKDDIESIHQRYASEDENARTAVEVAQALMETVEQRTMLDRFAPGYEAQDLRHRIEGLGQSQNHGATLAAQAEEAITQIWQVESHAIQEKAKHDAIVEIALTQIDRILTIVNENRVMEQEVEGGEPMEIENEFWSEGEYGRLEQELNSLKAELDDRYNRKLTKERVETITRRSAEIEGRILQIGAESITKAILSEARVETAEDIVTALESKGWTIKGGEENPQFNYMGGEIDNDWRQGVCAVLENNIGEEITIIVDPESESQNRLIVHQETSKSGMIEKKVQEQMQVIQEQMRDLGYEIGESRSGVASIPQMGSADRLGQAHATEQIRQQIQH